ncbi:AraC family transcriptional regulator [Rhizobium halophytocola]|uniref:AraC-like DNA-binding protein n=1 Tax=Rhizobium halophytocola TaxID=735519 RepID=A0ABS4E4U8_9HYPH|nr:helix-turn-helix transcriptional regulator [Rhizobium halophytocola]MBP1852938.1 AraC-like DNA-binding protein [Rhizobium halophytocola]
MPILHPADSHELHLSSLNTIEAAAGPIKSLPRFYPAGHRVERHTHSRAQLLYAAKGVVVVATEEGRWMLPPGHALWIAPGIAHSVEMLVDVTMLSLYLAPGVVAGLPERVKTVGVTDLARALIVAAVNPEPEDNTPARAALIMPLLLDVISTLPERGLALPFPSDPRLAALCRSFVAQPTAELPIDRWADQMSMSRRTFTRIFRRETGLSLSTWRQQACLFAALPRLADGEPVTTVALDLGYDSVAAFTTMFKRMLGSPPRIYLARDRSQPAASASLL